ncbi:oxidoreductase [Amorphoplanes digitatis]|uniref:NAD(P)-dependent dehydrogenase (Short-subunit alcohol dehydrogenase family) n=1 Tax=Actinoplanes digitatis TaxID=1868 RepID=A0A7W7I1U6_9ACTN|nr:oxidoreductase [Actinoplanes digitatis]MBB4764703.1 NAD(P)-dependent dehydrogenase (short-subunit alcohol dehydrogenase family) [Actinoplanes digitatis]GID91345.1 short-chain dehydrogenase/reductase [Actinoplanes digitatis]
MGRVAIVTGASAGIGAATSRLLRERGFRVYAVARRLDRMAGLAALGIDTVRADVTDEADLVALVDRVVTESGRIDVLVNNAGYGSFGALEDVPLDEARRQFEVNVFGAARLCQLVLPHLRARGSGRIINVSSVGARMYQPLGGWYHATKYALEGLSDCLRVELRPLGIDVVMIQPGGIDTEFPRVAGERLLASSGDGAYAGYARRYAASLNSDARGISPPSVVARAIGRAATVRRPRARYAVGRGARAALLARWLLPDRAYDRVLVGLFTAISRAGARGAGRV